MAKKKNTIKVYGGFTTTHQRRLSAEIYEILERGRADYQKDPNAEINPLEIALDKVYKNYKIIKYDD